MQEIDIAPARLSAILTAAEAAARAIPPAFPLDATVAVNPFLGQAGEEATTAAARLARVAGVSVFRSRAELAAQVAEGRITDDDLAAALIECPSPLKPVDLALLKARMHAPAPAPRALPTVADLAAEAGRTDWPAVIERCIGLWAGGHFDRGQALWMPAPGADPWAAWRAWASRDLTPEIAGLKGFCAHVAALPDTPERAIARAARALGITAEAAETAFHRLLMDLGGWAQHARWLLWQAEQSGRTDPTLAALLAIRLSWEAALLDQHPELSARWAEIVAAHAAPLAPTQDTVIDAILQDAAERAWQRRLAARLDGPASRPAARPALQAAFCIDVRSEPFRRALEAQAPGIETIGFAGFFGLAVAHAPHGSDVVEDHLPALLAPSLRSTSQQPDDAEQAARIGARAIRAWGRFRQAAVSSFAFVEAAGLAYGGKLLKGAFGKAGKPAAPAPAPRFSEELPPARRAEIAAGVLRAMGLRERFAPLVLLVGHGAHVTNNPHESAYHCGACGGHTGAVSARLLASLLNDPATRAHLPEAGISLPEDTRFVAALHDTTTDEVTLFDTDAAPAQATDLAQVQGWLRAAGQQVRAERALRLPGATPASVAARARDWAEIRPEWGLAGCAAFIAAPREVTTGKDLGGRAFLHSYDWTADEGFATLELILTAPVVVASWISLQYYGSSLAPTAFGAGNKLIHNVLGGIGVIEGNGGRLRAGLPWQAVHDGERPAHAPQRLTVLIEAPCEAISQILARHPQVAALFDNGWLHLMKLEGGRIAARYRPGGGWRDETPPAMAA
ncbi:YbcC family protein [Pseudoruegeria aquimaris]